jgi:hypothetical protein
MSVVTVSGLPGYGSQNKTRSEAIPIKKDNTQFDDRLIDTDPDTPDRVGVLHRLRYGNSFFKLIDPEKMPPKWPPGLANQLGFRYTAFFRIWAHQFGQSIPSLTYNPRIAMISH